MATFVLVPGAWHGGWCWKKVRPLLTAAGHDVFTPSLTGLGEREHLASPEIGLDTHIQDIVGLLTYEDLREVILVGHSYGGMVIAPAAAIAAARVAQLVYLDAYIPTDGLSMWDLMPEDLRAARAESAVEWGEGWRIPPYSARDFGITAVTDQHWVDARLVPQPLKTFQQPVRFSNPAVAALPRTYISCAEGGGAPELVPFVRRAQAEEGWRYREIATCHAVMVTAPRDLAALLLEVVRPADAA